MLQLWGGRMSSDETVAPLLIEAEGVKHQGRDGTHMNITCANTGVMVALWLPLDGTDEEAQLNYQTVIGIGRNLEELLERVACEFTEQQDE